jgi:hypothetical protein
LTGPAYQAPQHPGRPGPTLDARTTTTERPGARRCDTLTMPESGQNDKTDTDGEHPDASVEMGCDHYRGACRRPE